MNFQMLFAEGLEQLQELWNSPQRGGAGFPLEWLELLHPSSQTGGPGKSQQLLPAFGIWILEYSTVPVRHKSFGSDPGIPDFLAMLFGISAWDLSIFHLPSQCPGASLLSQSIPSVPEHSLYPRPGLERNPNHHKTPLEHFIFQALPNSLNSVGKILGAGLGLALIWERFWNSRGLIWRKNLWNRRKRK